MCHQFLILLEKLNHKHPISHFVHSDNDIVEVKDYFRWDTDNGISQNLSFYKYLFTYIHIPSPTPSFPSSSICVPESIFTPASPCFPSSWEMSSKFSRLTCRQKFLYFHLTQFCKIMLTNLHFSACLMTIK